MSVNKIGHHDGLIIILIFSFILLLVLQDSPARSRVSSDDDDAGYRAKKSERALTSLGSEDFQKLLQEARKLYNEMDYEGAIQKLMAAQGEARTALQKADLYFYLSLALYATQSERERSEILDAIENVFLFDYQREPDPDICPSGYVEIFNELKESYGAIKILSEPSGADVYINRNLAGKTPLTIGAKAGPIDILIKRGKVEKQDQLEVLAGEVTPSPIYELAGKKGKFPIALVLGGVAIAGGAAAFLLKGGGGNGGGATTGSIQVSSSPTGAKIYLDGADTGKVTNATLTNVVAGSHTAKLTKDGYSDKEQSVSVTAGQTATVDMTLTKDTITVSKPTSGTTWEKGSSVEIKWQVSAGASIHAQPTIAGALGAGLQNQHRFSAQYLRLSRDFASQRRTDIEDVARRGGEKGLGRLDAIRGRQGTQGRPGVSASGNPGLISSGTSLISPNSAANPRFGTQTGNTTRALVISNIRIELYKGGSLAETIVSETENDGSYTWQVTSTLANGSDYKVKVSCSSDANIYGESYLFSIGTSTYEFVTKWGSLGTGDGQFKYPHGVAVDSAHGVYVADYDNHRIQKFRSGGEFQGWSGQDDLGNTAWHTPGSGRTGKSGKEDGQFNRPKGMAVGLNQAIYIADNQNYRIQTLKWNTVTYERKWGSKGSGNSQFNDPVGIAVDSNYYVYVTDFYNHRVQKFDATGTFLGKWGSVGAGDGQFNYPVGIAVGGSYVYVVDSNNDRIQKFDLNGTFIAKWGSQGSANSQFDNPKGIAVDKDGYVYVVDQGNSRIQKFDSNGGFITKWGSHGSENGQFNQPWGIAVDFNGFVYVSDLNNHRIQKFRRVM